MKKSISTLSLFLIMATSCFAQLGPFASAFVDLFSTSNRPRGHCSSRNSNNEKGYIAISGGASIPKGAFAGTDITNSSAGFAKTGVFFDVSCAINLSKNFGVAALIRGQSNQLNMEAFASDLHKNYPTANWSVENKEWNSAQYLIGGYASFPLGRSKTSFESRALAGVIDAETPQITVKGIQVNSSVWAKESRVRGTGFAWLVGAGFKFDVGNSFCLLTNIDYLGATAVFKDVELTGKNGVNSKSTIKQNLGSLNFGVGFGIRL